MTEKRATIQDVANLAKVSITTVSRVLNKNYPVKDATKKKVEEAIERLSYKPNMLARGLIQNKTQTIGILTPSIENLFFSEVIKGIDAYIKKERYTSFLCNTEGKANYESLMADNLLERSVDGIISIDPQTELIRSGFYEALAKKIPTVLINGYNKGVQCNFILNDQEVGTYEALKYLIKLGHRTIAFLRGKRSHSYDIKESVYRKFMKDNGLEIIEDRILVVNSGNDLETVQQSRELLKKRLKKGAGFTALFACNDWMAVGALNAVNRLGLSVKNDLSIIGFDNTIISQISEPQLTTVDQNMNRLGVLAAKRIKEIIKEKDTEIKKILLDTRLVIRKSTRELKQGNK